MVPRLIAGLVPQDVPPLGEAIWKDALLALPREAPTWRDVLTGETVSRRARGLSLARVLARLPVALLVSAG